METAFEKRLNPGKAFEERLKTILERMGHTVALNGTEHTHKAFVDMLRSNNSDAAKFVRFAPDGVYLTKTNANVIYYDAKAARTIEKDAWTVYNKYCQCGCRVVLYVQSNIDIYWQDIQRVELEHGSVTVSRYARDRRFPVDEDGWITPRNKHGFFSGGKMSGTPYREILFDSMNTFDDWLEYLD